MSPKLNRTGNTQKIDQRMREICIGYMQLMLDCANDIKKRDSFVRDPRPYLNDIGMHIPEKVAIHLKVGQSFPALFIKTLDEQIAVYEGKLSLMVVEEMRDHEKHVEKVVLKKPGEIEFEVNESLNDPEVQAVVVMPFFDLYTEILGEIKFQDGAEIILTTC